MFRAFFRAPGGKAGLAIFGVVLLTVLIAPEVFSTSARRLSFAHASESPSGSHLLGTDLLGRDIFARVLVASRLSITLALLATLIGVTVGTVWGVGATLLPGRLQAVGLRLIDSMMAFPAVLVAVFVGAIIGAGSFGAVLGVGLGLTPSFARMTSTLALSIGSREYVVAARMMGIRGPRLMARHILPNIGETLAITTTVAMGSSIVALSTLSFLGLGVQPPHYDWGALLTEGVKAMYEAPASAIGPATAILIVALSFGYLGEAIARAMNPALWKVGVRSGSGPSDMAVASVLLPGANQSDGDPAPGVYVPLTPPGETVMEVSGLTVEFPGPRGPVRVVDHVSFGVCRGEMIGIAGESGSGKTMTAMAIAGLVPHPGVVSGTVVLDGKNLATMTRRDRKAALAAGLAVVFQDPMSSLNPALRIGRQMSEGVEFHTSVSHRAAREMAAQRLGEVGVPSPRSQLSRYPHELSGGMRQRVMIATGLMNTPALLIVDEPTTSLDVTIQAKLMELLGSLNEQHHMAVVLISHNLGLVSQNCSRVLTMYAGRIVEDGPSEEVLGRPLHPYTAALLEAVPTMSQSRTDRLVNIPGRAPELGDQLPGCPYQPRCTLAVDRCSTQMPPLQQRAGARRVACWVANEDLE